MNPISSYIPAVIVKPKRLKDDYLDKLLSAVNLGRPEKGLKLISYGYLNLLLKRLGKSKKNWDRNIFIGNVLDAQNPGAFFFWSLKQK